MKTKAPMVEKRYVQVFGVTMYFAICHDCKGWVKSSVGQFCWTQRSQRNRIAVQHEEIHRLKRRYGQR